MRGRGDRDRERFPARPELDRGARPLGHPDNRERLVTRARTALERQGQRVALHAATVRGLDPVVTMARGWSITRTADGRVVRSAADVAKGDTITTLVADGAITSTVEGTDR